MDDTDLLVALVKNRTITREAPPGLPLAVVDPPPETVVHPLGFSRIHHPSPEHPALAVCDQLDRDVQHPHLAPEPRWVWVPGSPLHVTCRSCREWRHA